MKNSIGSISLVVALILSVTIVGCGGGGVPEITEYNLTISSTAGGSVTSPSEGMSIYDQGTAVNLVAEAEDGYRFVNWTGDVDTIANTDGASTTITMSGDYEIVARFEAIPPTQYSLTIHSTTGGSVTAPGQGTFTYDAGTVVNLVAEAEEGYEFVGWTGDVGSIVNIDAASTNVTMNAHCSITASFAIGIYDWYDLDTIRYNLGGSYVLMNDLDSTTAGYTELASMTTNEGEGWQPIGSLLVDPFTGRLDGQGYEIRGLFINRPDEDGIGLFGSVGGGGVVENLGVINTEVTGYTHVGGLVGHNSGTVSNFYLTGAVAGEWDVGGLVGSNDGTLRNSYSAGTVIGNLEIGGLVGWNVGSVSNSYSVVTVTGGSIVGGLAGFQCGTVINSYYVGSVTGEWSVGGLVGENRNGTVSNSHYNWDDVLINGKNVITIGALFDEDFDQWLASDKFLEVNEKLSQENGYYVINNVDDFKELLTFGQDDSLKFKLKNDLDLGAEPNFYIPYLAGEFDGNGRKIVDLSISFDFISQVGLFGYLASGGKVTGVGAENVNVVGNRIVGGLVGGNDGNVINSYFTGAVAGHESVGGLVGDTGWNGGSLSNSYYNYEEVLINGRNMISLGALFGEDFEQWLANDKFLDINKKLSQEDGYYLINDVSDFKQLLAFGQDGSLRFRLENDLDLAAEPDFYIPYLAGEFDGDGHKIRNLTLDRGSMLQIGLFGYVASGGKVSEVGAENVNIAGSEYVGGLVGWNDGTVSDCYATGSLAGEWGPAAGLVGRNQGTVSNCCFTGSVTGGGTSGNVGGLIGMNDGTVRNCYSTGSVTGGDPTGGLVGSNFGTVSNSYCTASASGRGNVGGLVGYNGGTVRDCYSTGRVTGGWGPTGGLVGSVGWSGGSVSSSYWDTKTSGQATSAGGTGKTTTEMKTIATFSGAGWNIITVAPGVTDPAYTWNIVNGVTYPFLSWQSVG
ncbi:MAG: GLUG motif-containing protein [Dehalococcoidia bacterium]